MLLCSENSTVCYVYLCFGFSVGTCLCVCVEKGSCLTITKLEIFFRFIKKQYNLNKAEKSKENKLTFLLPLLLGSLIL